jgi:hypothetical protein
MVLLTEVTCVEISSWLLYIFFAMCYVQCVFYYAVLCQYVLGVDRTEAVVFMEFVRSLNFTENMLSICPTY